MKKTFYQQKATFCQNALKTDQTICTFWTDENDNIDEDNIPCDREIAVLLKTLMTREVKIERTGIFFIDEE